MEALEGSMQATFELEYRFDFLDGIQKGETF